MFKTVKDSPCRLVHHRLKHGLSVHLYRSLSSFIIILAKLSVIHGGMCIDNKAHFEYIRIYRQYFLGWLLHTCDTQRNMLTMMHRMTSRSQLRVVSLRNASVLCLMSHGLYNATSFDIHLHQMTYLIKHQFVLCKH